MTMWKPGMRCVCIINHPDDQPTDPVKGSVATVANVYTAPDGELMLELHEFPAPETDDLFPGYRASDFRPLSETRLDQFRQHLAPMPKVEERV